MAVALLASATPIATALDTEGLVAPSIEASAAMVSIDSDTGIEYVKYSDHVKITGYSGDGGELQIPETLGKLKVKEIAKNAFTSDECAELTKITIPESVEFIGENAFAGCTNVTEGYIPSKYIGICAACKVIKVSENVKELVKFEVLDAHTTKVTTSDGLASLYTEYTLDKTSLAEKALKIPEFDVSGLTAQNFENFVKEHSIITDVWIYNKDCKISDGLIPETGKVDGEDKPVTVHGYRVSTARDYAIEGGRNFVPIDGQASAEDIEDNVKISEVTADEVANTQKFTLTATATTGDYSVFETGILIDRNNAVTSEDANEKLTLDNDELTLIVASEEDSTQVTKTVAENGYGLWVRPYVIVDNGSGDREQAVIKYGDAQYIFSEEHVKSKTTVSMKTESSTTQNNTLVCTVDGSSKKNIYTVSEVGIIYASTDVVVGEENARTKLTLDYTFTGKSTISSKKASDSFDIAKADKGVWVVGYTTVEINGQKVTKYTDPYQYGSNVFGGVLLELTDTAISEVKFKLNSKVDTDGLTLIESGILTDKTGAVRETSDAETMLRVDSDFAAKQVFKTKADTCSVSMSDLGNGIWYVGYAIVEAEGKQVTIYSIPKYVESEVQQDGVSLSMTFSQDTSTKYGFRMVARPNGETPVESGVIISKDGSITDEETARQTLKYENEFDNKIFTHKTTGTITSYGAAVTDTGSGIWCVAYFRTAESGIHYTDPVYIHNYADVAEANLAVNMVDEAVEGEPNKRGFRVTAASDVVPSAMGVILDKSGSIVDEADAKARLTLDSSFTKTAKADASNYGAAATFTGNGIWIVGYATIKVDGETFTKYTEPKFVPNP